jgi:hypothetical protein
MVRLTRDEVTERVRVLREVTQFTERPLALRG